MALRCCFVFARAACCHSDIHMSEGFSDLGRGRPAPLRPFNNMARLRLPGSGGGRS